MPELHTVYDFANETISKTFLFPIIFAIAGLIVLIYHVRLRKEQDGIHGPFKPMLPGADRRGIDTKSKGIVLGALFLLLGIVLPILFYSGDSRMFNFYKKVCKEKRYEVVSGRIMQFHQSKDQFHDTERFKVNNVYFEFGGNTSDDYGYRTDIFPYDPLKSNLFVRISYFNDGKRKVILILETE